MRRRAGRGEGGAGSRALLGAVLVAAVLTGCTTTRVVPIPTGGVALDPARGTATVEAEGVQIVVRPSAWRGTPPYLADYVTPFHLLVANASPVPLAYDYADLRLFDEARFQYTALTPTDVGRILRGSRAGEAVVVATRELTTPPLLRRRGPPCWECWDPWGWWWGPRFYDPPPRLDDVFLQALPVGTLQADARLQGFVYFPRLRPRVSRLAFEFHHRLGGAPRVLTLLFAVERAERGAGRVAA